LGLGLGIIHISRIEYNDKEDTNVPITKEGLSYLADVQLGKVSYADFKLKLFTLPAVPDADSEYADFTWEDDATAGTAKTLASATWTHAYANSKEDYDYPEQTFTYTNLASDAVYGAAIVDNGSTKVIAYSLGTGGDWPATPDPGEALKIKPDMKDAIA
jgi:hypothetical protein